MGDSSARRRLASGITLLVLLGGLCGPPDSLAISASSAEGHGSSSEVALNSEVLSAHTAARTSASRTTARAAGSVDVNNKSAVNAAYLSRYAPGLSVPTGWAGNENRCIAGTQASGSRTSTLSALNFARSLAGLTAVTFSSDLNNRSQQSALMMSANKALSHTPPKSWRCYSATGAANAGSSNLALAYPSLSSAGIVSLYLEDAGSTNRGVGHRRWLLNPFATTMGSGSTNTANAITVIGPTSTSRANPALVAWPSAGWFPNTLEPSGRWSLSLGDRALSFRWAAVRVWRDGKLLKVSKNPVVDGYAQPTVSWQMPTNQARSGTFKVEVSSIRKTATSTRYTRIYTVRMFTPGT
jgi:uncharacterized protein YkwD